MDLGNQPTVLAVLTQVEEMLISRANPILQVTHAHGGQYKYYGHTICFSQDISNLATYLPHLVSELDILVVRKCNSTNKPYELFVSRTHVLAVLQFKMENNPYYKDVQINPIALTCFPLISANISPLIHILIVMLHYLINKACTLQINHQIHLNPMNWNPCHLFQHKLMLELRLKKLDSCYTYQISHYHLPLIGPLYKCPL